LKKQYWQWIKKDYWRLTMMNNKVKVYKALIKIYIEGGQCPHNIGLESTCKRSNCKECRREAIDNIINHEIYEKLKNEYVSNCFGACPKVLGYKKYENCKVGCRECRKQAIERIEKDENE
jgi:hypothetical protein